MPKLDRTAASSKWLSASLMATTSLVGVLAAFPAAYGQPVASGETVIVTGTAIRGIAPVGTNLITVDRSFIESSGAGNTEQLLSIIPQLSITFGVAGQGGDTNNEGTQTGPSLHGIGSQNAASTLILIDGHRLPSAGQSTSVVDPSIIPSAALQSVAILPDGASSIYGADAVSGVMNFITRKDFTGWETQAQYGIADHYNSASFSQLLGHSWQGGNVMVSYQYSNASHLMNRDRAYLTSRQDILRGVRPEVNSTTYGAGFLPAPPAGSLTVTPDVGHGTTGPFNVAIPYPTDGVNKQNFNCPIATIAAAVNPTTGKADATTQPVFLYPYNGTSISVTQTTPPQGVCSQSQYLYVLPSEVRNSALLTVNQQVTSSLTFSATVIYSGTSASKPGYNTNKGGTNHGTITATVFGPTSGKGTPLTFKPDGTVATSALTGGQINPFYVGNATTGTASEIIRYDFNELLASNGIQPVTHDGNLDLVGIAGLDWDMGGDWDTTLDLDIGYTQAPENDYGALCAPCANLALNGTLNSGGTASNTAATSAGGNVGGLGLGSIYNVTEPLTTLNALDVWNPAGPTNRTSPSVLKSLVDSNIVSDAHTTMDDLTLKTSGPLWDLWGAGPIKVAFGGEYEKTLLWRFSTNFGLGGTTNFARSQVRGVNRLAQSAFVEFNIPIVHGSDTPFMHELGLDVSGRYDHFSDFGETKNPKIGLDWVPFDGIRAHASFGTSFVEPAINTVQAPGTAGTVATTTGTINATNTILFNSTTGYSKNPNLDEGSGIAGTWVANAQSCQDAGSNPVDKNGATVTAASGLAVGCKLNFANSIAVTAPLLGPIQPEKGISYSAGVDIAAGKIFPALDGLNVGVTYYNIKFTGYITGGGVTTFQPQVISFAPPGGWGLTDPVIQQVLAGNSGGSSLPSTIYSVQRSGVQNAFDLWQQGLDISISYRLDTDDLGSFTFNESANQILSAQQGSNSVARVSTVDGRGGRQTNIELTSVTSVSWHLDAYTAQLQVSYAHPFSLANNSFPFNLPGPAALNGVGGYMHVGAQYTVNLHTAYNLPEDWISGVQVFANIQNLLDTPPPFSNAGSVSNGEVPGNPIGREFMIGFRLNR